MAVDWSSIINPYNPYFKQFLLQLLKDNDYLKHEKTIDKMAGLVSNAKDYEEIGNFILCVWESGFKKAIDENVSELRRLGLKVNITHPEKSG